MPSFCNICKKNFEFQKDLDIHTKSTLCTYYKNIIFKCSLCNFETFGRSNIHDHINSGCDKTKICIDDKISQLQRELAIEKAKSRIFASLLENNTQIKVGDVFMDNSSSIEINCYKDKNIPIILHEEGIEFKTDKKKKSYRNVNDKVDFSQVIEPIIPMNEKNETSPPVNSVIIPDITSLFKELAESRIYINIIGKIRIARNIKAKTMNFLDLTENAKSNIEEIKSILISRKIDTKRLEKIILQSLTPLETRLLFPKDYHTIQLQEDDLELCDTMLRNNLVINDTMFDHNYLIQSICNYSLAAIPIKRLIEICLIPYFNKIIIYVPFEKSKADDPYSFYTLSKVTSKGQKKWNMDSRMENTASILNIHVLPFAINLFRKIYNDILSDNDFRKDYKSHSQIFQTDMEILLQAIILLAKPIKLSNFLRELVKEKSTYTPITDIDLFNLVGDDALQKRKFKAGEEPDIIEKTIKRLFDNITSENAVDFYRDFTSRFDV